MLKKIGLGRFDGTGVGIDERIERGRIVRHFDKKTNDLGIIRASSILYTIDQRLWLKNYTAARPLRRRLRIRSVQLRRISSGRRVLRVMLRSEC